MSILKNILGAFVEFKDDPPATAKQQEVSNKKEPTQVRASSDAAIPKGSSDINVDGNSSSSQYQQHFKSLLEEANNKNPMFAGTDFKEFIESKDDVEAIADEPTKYRTAFNVLKRTGLTKEKLLLTGNEYLKLIDQDMKAFENAYLDHYKSQVENKEKQLQQKAKELQLLNEKIDTLNKELKQLNNDVLQNKERLTSNKNAFILAGEDFKKGISAELKKIEEYFS